MKWFLIIFLMLSLLVNLSFGESSWSFSLQEKSYYFSNYLDLGLFLSPLTPYGMLVFSPEKNLRFWFGSALNEFPIIGGGIKLYPNLVLNLEYRENGEYLEILIPFILEKLSGGFQINIGILGNTNFNIESAFSYPINKSVSFGAYIYFPFTQAGKVYVFVRYYWKNYFWSLAFNGERLLFSILKYLKF